MYPGRRDGRSAAELSWRGPTRLGSGLQREVPTPPTGCQVRLPVSGHTGGWTQRARRADGTDPPGAAPAQGQSGPRYRRRGGWEKRGPQWRGFASGGGKVLFRFEPANASRLRITKAAIDAFRKQVKDLLGDNHHLRSVIDPLLLVHDQVC
ncbi:DUF3991 domain-containing protein [Bradyrhizobium sp. Pa8]